VLIVLDNFEQLLTSPPTPVQVGEGRNEESAVALVTMLLAACPGLVILATSRERLHLRAEQRYRVQPLPLAPSIQIFTQRTQAVAPDFTLTTENEVIIAEICRQLDCLPLAIELVAVHADLLTPATLLARLHEQRLNLLTNGPYDLPIQQRSLRNAIYHQYHRQNESEKELSSKIGFQLSHWKSSQQESSRWILSRY
jgi:predicted ATPase